MADTYTPTEMLGRLVGFDTTSVLSNMALIQFVRDYLRGHGVDSTLLPNEDNSKANLYATIGPRAPGGVVLAGHSDVVPVAGQPWDSDPFQMVEKNGRLYGRGTADMKCFPAVALAMVPEFLKRDLKVPIHIALTYDEEIGCLSAWSLAEQMRDHLPQPHALIVGEPTMMQVVHSHKAINSFFTEFTGHEAHSSLVESGVSAVHYAGELLHFLNRLQDELRARARPSDFNPGYGTINVGVINGGTAGNILARKCKVQWEYRALPGDDPMEVLDRVQAYCDGELLPRMRRYAPDATIETRKRAGVPPLIPEQHNPADLLCRHLTGANASASVAYAAEAGIFQQAGFHVVICGPGDIAQAHQPNEFIETSQVAACEQFMRRLADWSVKGGAKS